MRAPCSYDYAIIRVVPRVEREEFINVGVIVSCPALDYLAARIELDEERLLRFAPGVDIDLVRENLASIPAICTGSGPIGRLTLRERFHWLVAPRSTMIQTSSVHTGRSDDPSRLLEQLLQKMVRTGRN